ncbi:hypothetical protein OKW39_000833 [Paraburkholderia sp. MM6662-R1]
MGDTAAAATQHHPTGRSRLICRASEALEQRSRSHFAQVRFHRIARVAHERIDGRARHGVGVREMPFGRPCRLRSGGFAHGDAQLAQRHRCRGDLRAVGCVLREGVDDVAAGEKAAREAEFDQRLKGGRRVPRPGPITASAAAIARAPLGGAPTDQRSNSLRIDVAPAVGDNRFAGEHRARS